MRIELHVRLGQADGSQDLAHCCSSLGARQSGVDRQRLVQATQRQKGFKSKHDYTLEEFGLSRDWIQSELKDVLDHYSLPMAVTPVPVSK